MTWTVRLLNETVADELRAQPDDIRASLIRVRQAISRDGPTGLPRTFVKNITGDLWELRLKGKSGIARAFYVTASRQRLFIVRIFTKKTQKTPPQEIKLALARAKEIV